MNQNVTLQELEWRLQQVEEKLGLTAAPCNSAYKTGYKVTGTIGGEDGQRIEKVFKTQDEAHRFSSSIESGDVCAVQMPASKEYDTLAEAGR